MIIKCTWLFQTLLRGYAGITLFPFIIINGRYEQTHPKFYNRLIRHEREHIYQQMRGLIIGFYVRYAAEYLFHRIKGKTHYKAYYNISYEKLARKKEKEE